MSNRKITQSLRERTKSALERISSIEDDLGRLQQGISQMLTQVQNQLATQQETLTAVVQSVGSDEIQAIIVDTRKRQAEERAEAARKEIAELIEKGTLVLAETVGDDSFLTGHDVDEKGETVPPGFGHVHFKQVKPELQEKVRGQKVGAKISATEGTESQAGFVIDSIYTFVPPKPPEPAEEQKTEAPNATQAEGEVQADPAAAEAEAATPKVEGEKK